jgi:hypothetical protein
MTKQLTKPAHKNISCTPDDAFTKDLVFKAMLASHDLKDKNFDLSEAKEMCSAGIASLNTKEGLQTMLSAQMLTIHQLQQKAMAYAHGIKNLEIEKYYTNTAIKLANCFVQQANLLAKFQGHTGQKITVERVNVHHGGQAIVGTIHRGCKDESTKK